MNNTPPYRGRFAPSPTGPLHFGSLVAAVGSYLEARHRGGEWLLRMEDLDTLREVQGAADAILRTLETYGLQWDHEVLYQSTRHEAYQAALETLDNSGLIYHCGCTRKEILASARQGSYGAIYPGTCRDGLPPGRKPRSIRVRTPNVTIAFEDRLQGGVGQSLREEVGDFLVRRADGLFAYQLAVVVDDAEQGITHVVRGGDLLDSTARQIHLQRALKQPTPAYLHLPLAINRGGDKLSKQTHAPALPHEPSVALLILCLEFLGQTVPAEVADASMADFWPWAIEHWVSADLPRTLSLPAPFHSQHSDTGPDTPIQADQTGQAPTLG